MGLIFLVNLLYQTSSKMLSKFLQRVNFYNRSGLLPAGWLGLEGVALDKQGNFL
jgi:hypothetical protein